MNINNLNKMINIDIEKTSCTPGVQNVQGNKENRPSFGEYLKNSLDDANKLQIESERQSTLLATGQADNIHDVTIAAAKAKISLDLVMAVRGKVVEAYKEVMRMQV